MKKRNVFEQEEFQRAYGYCLTFTRNEEDAWDLLQSSYEKFLKKDGQRFEKPKAYLYMIIRNQYIDDFRKGVKWNYTDYQEYGKTAIVEESSLEEVLISHEEFDFMMNLLSEKERELLYLWAIEQYTVQEIADFTKSSKGTLLSRLHRLKKKLRRELELREEEWDRRKAA